MTSRLFATERTKRPRWTGNVLPVLAAPLCPRQVCRASLATLSPVTQPALFLHGGYGGAERVRKALCVRCGWWGEVSRETVSPRRLET